MRIILLLATLLISTGSFAQKKLIKKLLSTEKDTTRGPSFLPVPVVGYSQEKGLELGAGAIYSFYFDKTDLTNRSTNIYSNMSFSTKGIYNFMVKGDAWTKGNAFHITGDIRLKKNPFDFFGTGNQTKEIDQDRLIQNVIKLGFEAEKKIADNVYTGIILSAENQKFKDKISGGIFTTSNFNSKDGGFLGMIGLSQSYDTRNSNNYPTEGVFTRLTLQYVSNFDNKEKYNGVQTKLNLRGFFTVHPKFVIGVQGYYHGISGKNIPFYALPQFGNDELMRGYYTGRYRDKQLLAAQTEIRYRYNSRFGAVVFAGLGNVFGDRKFELTNLKPNYGAGFRYFFDPEKGLSLRLDYGIGEQLPNEKRQSGFYIGLSEAF